MKNIFKILVFSFVLVQLVSCKDDDETTETYIIPYAEQKVTDELAIEEFLTTHYLDAENVIQTITSSQTPLKDNVNLKFKDVYVSSLDLTYKLYYLKLNEGSATGKRPCALDSTFVSYKGTLLDGTLFDTATEQDPVWLQLEDLVAGWSEIVPFFKSGQSTIGTDGIVDFTDYGDGIMILPSAFGYYSQSTTLIPSYSPLIFYFQLKKVNHKDHDRDKVLTKDELTYDEVTGITTYLDTDGDGTYDYADVDDDADGFLTKTELKYTDVNGDTQYYEFANIPMCSGGTKKRHLDASCH